MLVVAVCAIVAIGFGFCKKCSTCTATKTGSIDITGGETCGNAAAINDYEKLFKDTYEPMGYTVTCVE